jgi:hypothetical protein
VRTADVVLPRTHFRKSLIVNIYHWAGVYVIFQGRTGFYLGMGRFFTGIGFTGIGLIGTGL